MKWIRAGNKKKEKRENSGLTCFLRLGDESGEIIPGYIPLSKNAQVVQCANIIADLVSSMTIMLMQNGEKGDMRIKNELSKKIDVYPCKSMDRKNFIFKIAKDMILYGNSVVLPTVNGMRIDNLQPLEQNSCSYIRADNEAGYNILYKGQYINPDDVLHFVYMPDENDPFRGVGQKNAIIDAARMLTQAQETKKKFLRSKYKPSLIMSIQADSEELMDKKSRKEILGSYVADTEEGEPWIIPAGEVNVQTVTPLNLKDIAIQESIELDKRTIAAAFNMPAFMVGIGEFRKEAYNNFVSTTIMSIAMIIQQQFTRKLLFSGELYFKLNYKTLLQYNLEEKGEFIKRMVEMGMLNRNEGRTEFDYNPVSVDGMDDYNVLENFIPVSELGNQKKLKNVKE